MKYEIVAINCITLTTDLVFFWHREGLEVGVSVSDMFMFFYRAVGACFNMYDDAIIYICLFFVFFANNTILLSIFVMLTDVGQLR